MNKELTVIDSSQCQGEILEGSFMTFGPRSYKRCKAIPTWIAFDIREGEFYGAMSLCNGCKKICTVTVPTAKYQQLKGGS